MNTLSAFARDDTSPIAEGVSVVKQFPPGSIGSTAEADAALDQAARERAEVERRYAQAVQACSNRFFVTSCTDDAADSRREALQAIHRVEIEANAFMRHARVAERDQALESKQQNDALRQEERNESEARNSSRHAQQPKEPKQSKQPPASELQPRSDREASHAAKLKRLQAKEAEEAKERAENVAAYERKVQAAKAHQEDVARRKAEKEQKRKSAQERLPAM